MKFSLTLEIYSVTFDLCEIIHFSTIIYFMFIVTYKAYIMSCLQIMAQQLNTLYWEIITMIL